MIQTKTEIQKLIRKEKPEAHLLYIKNKRIHYRAYLGMTPHSIPVFFSVPFDDTGEAQFTPTMPSQLLIRYLID